MTDTYIRCRREDGGNGCIPQVADSPSNIEALLCEMLAAHVLMSTWGPILALYVVHPLLQPGFVVQGKPLEEVKHR